MLLNEWFRDARKKRGMTLQDLAFKINLGHSQLSRIESNRSELNFFTMVRLMYGLDLSLRDFFNGGFVYGLPVPEFIQVQNEEGSFPCFSFNDFELLDLSGALSMGTAASILIRLIERFVSSLAPELPASKVALISPNVYSLLSNGGDYSLLDQYLPGVDFSYPANLDPKVLKKVYLSGGVLIGQDLGRFIKQLRISRQLSLRDLGKQTGMTHTVIESFEKNITQRNKLRDILQLDQALKLNGELVVYAWRASELYNGNYRTSTLRENVLNPWKDPDLTFIEKLVVISRFYQHHFPNNQEWLDWYRRISVKPT